MGLFEPDRRVLPLRGHFLIEDVFNIVHTNGLMVQRPLHRFDQGMGAVLVCESEQLFDALGEGLLGVGQTLERGLGDLAQSEKGRDLLGVPGTAVVLVGHLAMLGEFEALCALPAAGMGGHDFVLQGAGELVVVGFDSERFANKPGGHGSRCCHRQWTQTSVCTLAGTVSRQSGKSAGRGRMSAWVKAVDGPLPGGGVDAGIGHLIAPRVGLALEVGEITKRAQGPEVMPPM